MSHEPFAGKDQADVGMWATFMAGQLTHDKPGSALRI
jgi:hypothetical protein